MNKIAASIMIALFLGGTGVGMGSTLIYQFATGGLEGDQGPNGKDGNDGTDGIDGVNGTDGIDGVNGTDGIDGISGLQQLNGIYEGDNIWASVVILANATVILRNGRFFGSTIYVYGNLTIENVELYLTLYPMGNATVLINNSRYKISSEYIMLIADNASVTFLNDFGPYPTGLRLRMYGTSHVYFKNSSINGLMVFPREQSRLYFENVYLSLGLTFYAYDSSRIYLNNTIIDGTDNIRGYNNGSIYISSTSINGITLYDNSTTELRTNSTVDTLNAYQTSIMYLYQSEGCVINTQNLYDSAQVITL